MYLRTYYVPGTVLSNLHVWCHFFLKMPRGGYYRHFAGKDTEAQ